MKSSNILRVIALILLVLGASLLWSVDWKIAVGVLLFITGNNIENAVKVKRREYPYA